MSVLHLSNEAFSKVISEHSLVVIDFWATWCGPCKMIAPTIEALGEKYEGKALIAKVDVDQAGAVAQQFGIMSIPTIVILKDGKEVDRKVGVMPEAALSAAIDAHL